VAGVLARPNLVQTPRLGTYMPRLRKRRNCRQSCRIRASASRHRPI